MAYFAERALAGGALYPAPTAAITNNYPPLSFYVFGTAGRLVHDTVLGGRLVSLVSMLGVAVGIYAAVRRIGAAEGAAAFAALVFLGFDLTFFHTYAGIADPQWLAHAAMVGALLLLLSPRPGPLRPGAIVLACLLMAVGGLVKHNLLALPMAASLWLLARDRRGFLIWTATGLAAVALSLLGMHAAYGPAALADILGHERLIDWGQWPDALVYLLPMVPLAAAAVVLARLRGEHPGVRLVLLFAAFALPFAVIQRLGEGVNVNAYFEALIALSISGGAALDAARRRPAGERLRRWGGLALAAPLVLAAPYFLVETARATAATDGEAREWRRIVGEVAQTPGPVACEMLSICYWAGKGFELDFFNVGERLRAGASPKPLLDALAERRFAAILLIRDRDYLAGAGRLPPPIPEALEAAYAPVDAGPGQLALMRPKPKLPPASGEGPRSPADGRASSAATRRGS